MQRVYRKYVRAYIQLDTLGAQGSPFPQTFQSDTFQKQGMFFSVVLTFQQPRFVKKFHFEVAAIRYLPSSSI